MGSNTFAWHAVCARVGGVGMRTSEACVYVCEGPVACVHDSLDTGPSVWESQSRSGGFRAGSPQCYSSCQLWFPSPRSSSALTPSLPLMPLECFPFCLLPCFPSISPHGYMCRKKNQKKNGRLRRWERPGVDVGAVGWGLPVFPLPSWCPYFYFISWPLTLNSSRVIYLYLTIF